MIRSFMQKITEKPMHLSIAFLLVLSYFTHVHGFWNPPALFWDENYHIASAQKYLNGTFFMEPHPPLGKLMIAAGEALIDANADDARFIDTDYATDPPPGFSFVGYRFFPVMLSWLVVPLLFGIFFLITRKHLWATLLTFPYVFDNAIIVHARSAMLESTMLFFSALAIFAFLKIIDRKNDKKTLRNMSFLFGFAFGCALATKAFALLFILLVPFAFLALRPGYRRFVRFLLPAAAAFLIAYCGVWQIHFSLARTVNPVLPDAGYYQASEGYKSLLAAGKTSSPLAFPRMLRDSLAFVSHYQEGVPSLDLCKADENGSPWFLWPFGARTINYRWETPDGVAYRYLYLQSNPVAWFSGVLALVLTATMLLSSVLFPAAVKLRNRFPMLVFFTLYACYMIAISRIDRVMYLYHYFLPLLFSFILIGYVVAELQAIGGLKLTDERKTYGLLGWCALIFVAFQFFRAFTYYEPLTDDRFKLRTWLRTWELRCVHCNQDSPFVEMTR